MERREYYKKLCGELYRLSDVELNAAIADMQKIIESYKFLKRRIEAGDNPTLCAISSSGVVVPIDTSLALYVVKEQLAPIRSCVVQAEGLLRLRQVNEKLISKGIDPDSVI